jgi:simple sugar transport system permease protein
MPETVKREPPVKSPFQRRPFLHRLITTRELGPFLLLVIELIVFQSLSPDFLSLLNISNTLDFTVELGMMALATTLLMTAGEFDLSVGSVFGFTAVLMWTLKNSGVTSLPVAFVIAMVAAGLIGLANGWFVTRLRITSFLVTLGMLLVVRGAALFITSGFPQNTWSAAGLLVDILVGEMKFGTFHIYASLFWFVAMAIVLGYVLSRTKAGNWIQATGGNASAARARGVNVAGTKSWLFVLTAMVSGFSGIISSIRTASANPNSGTGYELEVIAMVVIGGTVLTGGRGTVLGTVLGVLMLRAMRNGIIMVGVPGLAYNIFIGAIILAMVALHASLERRRHAES